MPESGACDPNTIGAHSERPRISFSSASFTCPYPGPPSWGPRWVAQRPRSLTICCSGGMSAWRTGSFRSCDSSMIRSSGSHSSRTNVSTHSSCSAYSGSVEKSHDIGYLFTALGFVVRRLCYGFWNEANPAEGSIHELATHV